MTRSEDNARLIRDGFKQGAKDDREGGTCERCERRVSGARAWWLLRPNFGDPTEPVAYCRLCALFRSFVLGD